MNVCLKCATGKGARIPESHKPAWHHGDCDLCKERAFVTESRDFGITRKLIEEDTDLRYCEKHQFVKPIIQHTIPFRYKCPECSTTV